MATTVIAVIEHGLLQSVYSTDPDVDFELIDHDYAYGNEDEQEYIDERMKEVKNAIEHGEIFEVTV